jgi:hypothetical protein
MMRFVREFARRLPRPGDSAGSSAAVGAAVPSLGSAWALLAAVRRGVKLQAAADRVIRACALPGETPTWVAREGGRIEREYGLLYARVRKLIVGPDLLALHRRAGDLLNYHVEMLDAALNLAFPKYRNPRLEARRVRLDGLGPPAQDLRAVGSQLSHRLRS